ncbi:MAG: putative metalloprotease CJM1_0395 family protein, partial [Alkalispirochaeta sp.]
EHLDPGARPVEQRNDHDIGGCVSGRQVIHEAKRRDRRVARIERIFAARPHEVERPTREMVHHLVDVPAGALHVRGIGEVRHHERSHARTLGPYATTPIMYDTARGPDGEVVATGGRIGVDLNPVPGDPEATLKKARVVLNAAHAPGSPSAADMRVAADAYRLAQQAQNDISTERGHTAHDIGPPAAGRDISTERGHTTSRDV